MGVLELTGAGGGCLLMVLEAIEERDDIVPSGDEYENAQGDDYHYEK